MPRNKKSAASKRRKTATPSAQHERSPSSAIFDVVMGSPTTASATADVVGESSSTRKASENNASESTAATKTKATKQTRGQEVDDYDDLPSLEPTSPRPNGNMPSTITNAPPSSETSSNHEDSDEDFDDSDDESEDVKAYKAMARKRTRKYVRAFLNARIDKHIIDMKIDPLLGRENYRPWVCAIEVQLRVHQVWELVEDALCPLAKSDKLYMWYERMKDVACAVIYANAGEKVRKNKCFMRTIHFRDPNEIMNHLFTHYYHADDEDEDDQDDSD